MAFTQQPTGVQSFNIPVIYKTSKSITINSSIVEIAFCKVTIQKVLNLSATTIENDLTGEELNLIFYPTGQDVSNNYLFDINISQALKDNIKPEAGSLPGHFSGAMPICFDVFSGVKITVNYYYKDTSSGYIKYLIAQNEEDISGVFTGLDCIFDFDDNTTIDNTNFLIDQSGASKLLTESNIVQVVTNTQKFFVSFLVDTTNISPEVEITWTNNDNTTGTEVIAIAGLISQPEVLTASFTFSYLDNLSFSNGWSFSSSAVKYVKIRIINNVGNVTEYKTFYNASNVPVSLAACAGNDDISRRFHFINSLGGVDSISLTGIYEETKEVKKELFKRAKSTTFNAQQVVRNYNVKTADALIQFESNKSFPNSELKTIVQLIDSPFVVVEKGGLLIPVIIEKKSMLYFTTENRKEIKFKYKYSSTQNIR
jgi:hypothetical protein